MPNRYLRQSYIESEAVNKVGWQSEVVWTRLLVTVDDFGRCEANIRLLRPKLFPLRFEQVTEDDLLRCIGECENADLVHLYMAEGKEYLQMMKWEKGRAESSKYPAPSPEILASCYLTRTAVNGGKHAHTKASSRKQPRTADDGGLQMLPTPTPIPVPTPTPIPLPTRTQGERESAKVQGGEVDLEAENNAGPAYPEAQRPSLREVLDWASMSGLAEWKAQDWFQEMESIGWLDYRNRPVTNWKAFLSRVKTKWEADGRPKGPPAARTGRGYVAPTGKDHPDHVPIPTKSGPDSWLDPISLENKRRMEAGEEPLPGYIRADSLPKGHFHDLMLKADAEEAEAAKQKSASTDLPRGNAMDFIRQAAADVINKQKQHKADNDNAL